MQRAGLLGPDADIDNVLALKTPAHSSAVPYPLSTREGLARSPKKEARQSVTHGHVAIAGRRVTIPGHLVTRAEETGILIRQVPVRGRRSRRTDPDDQACRCRSGAIKMAANDKEKWGIAHIFASFNNTIFTARPISPC